MLVDEKDGVAVRCDQCGSRLIIAANSMQPAARRMPSGWMQLEGSEHRCPLCSRAAMATFRTR